MQKPKHIKSKILRSGIRKDKARLDLKLDSNTEDSKELVLVSVQKRKKEKKKPHKKNIGLLLNGVVNLLTKDAEVS